MSLSALLFVALGGAIGSVARALLSRAVPEAGMPWGTIAVNVTGSLLIGWLMGRLGGLDEMNLRTHSFWVAGFCGGFTTFSAFSWQTLEQMQRGQWVAAAANVLLSVVVCLGATWVGWKVAR